MEFHLVHPDKLKVVLTKGDLEALEIDYQDMDYSDEATRSALLALLEQGRVQAGFRPRRAKLYIEVFPSEEGGCVIYYTRLTGGELYPSGRYSPGPAPVVFAFPELDDLLEAAAKISGRYAHRIYKSSLYKMEDVYRLIVYPLDYADRLSIWFLCEFGRLVGEGIVLAAYTEEHGKLLADGDAIEKLAKIY